MGGEDSEQDEESRDKYWDGYWKSRDYYKKHEWQDEKEEYKNIASDKALLPKKTQVYFQIDPVSLEVDKNGVSSGKDIERLAVQAKSFVFSDRKALVDKDKESDRARRKEEKKKRKRDASAGSGASSSGADISESECASVGEKKKKEEEKQT